MSTGWVDGCESFTSLWHCTGKCLIHWLTTWPQLWWGALMAQDNSLALGFNQPWENLVWQWQREFQCLCKTIHAGAPKRGAGGGQLPPNVQLVPPPQKKGGKNLTNFTLVITEKNPLKTAKNCQFPSWCFNFFWGHTHRTWDSDRAPEGGGRGAPPPKKEKRQKQV